MGNCQRHSGREGEEERKRHKVWEEHRKEGKHLSESQKERGRIKRGSNRVIEG